MTKPLLLLLTLIIISCQSNAKKDTVDFYAKDNTTQTVTINKNLKDPALKKSATRGQLLYNKFCSSCHLNNGKGITKVFPPLANSDFLQNNQIKSIKALKYGISGPITVNNVNYNSTMSNMRLKNTEIADLMNYINNSWGNNYGSLITVEEVTKAINKY